ncbi:hypothetical protein DL239_20980 [Sedimentitalea sp. CY04]|uniref:Uncharacterized protein n=1 Tax=Parasedimentitalea denitrificans TaxID=2211118 RepID=A0ABX0WD85_9RHOB|nr:hypothetical protein [Sedimentitalea sp. CY04]
MQADTGHGTSRAHFGAAQKSYDLNILVVRDLDLPLAKGKFQTRLELSRSGLDIGTNAHKTRKISNCRVLNA